MRKLKILIVFMTFFILGQIIYAKSCTLDFGIGSTTGNSNEYNISTYPYPLEIIAKSKIYTVETQSASGTVKEFTRIRRDMFFRITRKDITGTTNSIFNIMSVTNTPE